jgi:hypothetical protein
MKTFIFFLFFTLINVSYSQQKPKINYTHIPHLDTALYYYNLGVKEKTNNNDGPIVKKFLAYVGLNEGYAWCAAFVSYCVGVCDFILVKVKSALARKCKNKYSFSEKDVRLHKKTVKSGYLAGWGHGNTPQGHVGIVYKWEDEHGQVVEGNANNRVSFNNRKLEPRNYFRIQFFTPIVYENPMQEIIEKMNVPWITNINKSMSNFATTR